MHIQSASVSFSASHQLHRQHQLRDTTGSGVETSRPAAPSVVSDPATPSIIKHGNHPVQALRETVDASVLSIKRILEAYLGKKIVITGYDQSQQLAEDHAEVVTEAEASATEPWVHLSLQEKEVSEFAIEAEITLANGMTRQVHIEQSMARELRLNANVSLNEAQKIIDPLVINFRGPVELSANRVEFDLDGDGTTESIATFVSDSAFLAYDHNGDGKINDGTELFGAVTGDGFAELGAYDDDGNGFIDQADAIYTQLLVFDPRNNTTRTLSETGVEALYLDKISTPFALKEGREELGYVRSSGFYLSQQDAGSLQQIDLVV